MPTRSRQSRISPRAASLRMPGAAKAPRQLFLQIMQRIERDHWLLENHRDAVAADPAQGSFIGVQQ